MLCNAKPLSSVVLLPLKQFGRRKVYTCPTVFRSTLLLNGRNSRVPLQVASPVRLFDQSAALISTSLKGAFLDLLEQNLSTKEKPEKICQKKTEVTFEEVVALIESGSAYLVDVREPQEIKETGILPKAVNISLTKLKASLQLEDELFEEQYHSSKPDETRLIFYGLCSVKSTAAVEIAHKLGFKKARHYPGGWQEWSEKKKS